MSETVAERCLHPEDPNDRAVREEYENTFKELRRSPPDAEPSTSVYAAIGARPDRSTIYVAKKLDETRKQLNEHKANTRAKQTELLEARKAQARIEAHVDYWREILRKDVGA